MNDTTHTGESTDDQSGSQSVSDRLDDLEAQTRRLREENEQLRERLETETETLRERLAAYQTLISELTPLSRAAGFEGTPGREETEDGTLLADGSNETYKILGQLDESSNGIGVLGCNTAATGTTYGVRGEVESPDGYGLYTPDDAKVVGDHFVEGSVQANGALYANASGDRVSRLYFGESSSPDAQLQYDNVEEAVNLSSSVKSGDTFEVQMDIELNQDGTRQRTAGPVAKGYIDADASIANAVNVNSVRWATDGFGDHRYEIDLTGESYNGDEYATYVNSGGVSSVSWAVASADNELVVYPSDDSQHPFQFVTHKLV